MSLPSHPVSPVPVVNINQQGFLFLPLMGAKLEARQDWILKAVAVTQVKKDEGLAQQCECTQCHNVVHLKMLKMVNFRLCVFYHKK